MPRRNPTGTVLTGADLKQALAGKSEEELSRTTIKLECLGHTALRLGSNSSDFVHLRKLSLRGNKLSTLKSVEVAKKITFLKVDDNQLDCKGLRPVCSLTELATLNVAKNLLTRLPKEISSLSILKALILSNNSLRDISVLKAAGLRSLNTLVLSHNKLTSDSFSRDTGILKDLPALATLSLSHNELTDFPFVASNRKLAVLRLNHNRITLVPPLGKNKELKLMDLGNNQLGDWVNVQTLQVLPKLRNLNLSGNPVSEATAYAKAAPAAFPAVSILDGQPQGEGHKKRKARRTKYGNEWKQQNPALVQQWRQRHTAGAGRKHPHKRAAATAPVATGDGTAADASSCPQNSLKKGKAPAEEATRPSNGDSMSAEVKPKKKRKRKKKREEAAAAAAAQTAGEGTAKKKQKKDKVPAASCDTKPDKEVAKKKKKKKSKKLKADKKLKKKVSKKKGKKKAEAEAAAKAEAEAEAAPSRHSRVRKVAANGQSTGVVSMSTAPETTGRRTPSSSALAFLAANKLKAIGGGTKSAW